MKRFVFSLMIVGGLALMAAPQASAQSVCGGTYAALLTGALTSETTDGALTAAAGVAALQFGAFSNTGGAGGAPGCAVTGELIYNAGDVQTSPAGVFFGPADCMEPLSGAGGVPCFDGANHLSSGYLTAGGPAGSYILTFAANYEWFDTTVGADSYGAIPFGFFVETTHGNTIAFGSSIAPPEADVTTDVPVLNLTLQKQAAAMPGLTFGAAPFLGAEALSCAGQGSNSTDAIAAAQAAAQSWSGTTITGSYGATLGSFVIFASEQAGGELTFNSNSSYVVPSSGPVPNNTFCPFGLIPANFLGAAYANSSSTPYAIFSDGAANEVASLLGTVATNPDCTDLNTAGAGYSDSSVQFGTTDQDSYVMVTGLVSTANGFVPVGESSYCIAYQQSPATAAFKTSAKNPAKSMGTTTANVVTVTNNNEALCDTETSMALASQTNAYTKAATKSAPAENWNTTCVLALAPSGASPFDAAAVGPNPNAQTVAETTCTCTCTNTEGYTGVCNPALPATSVTSPLSIASEACPISAGPTTITCAN